MPTATAEPLAEITQNKTPEIKTLLDLREQLFIDSMLKRRADDALASWTASRERQGVLLYLRGHTERALAILETEASHDFAKHFYARALLDAGYAAKAEKILAAQFTGKDLDTGLPLFRAQVDQGKIDDAEKTLKGLASLNTPETRAARIELMLRRGELERAAIEAEALFNENNISRAASFVFALVAQAAGDDDAARQAYERIAQNPPVPVNVLINLGTLYEDAGEYDLAIKCYETILREYPTNQRAKLYRRDAESSKSMFYDEDRERKEDKRLQILRTPVTDFELSVRSRNCLAKMKIETLGDLILKTESELLSYKNFGETSLQEIKSILASKGLRLGMRKEDALAYVPPEDKGRGAPPPPSGAEDLTARPIETLELSVRSRRAMERLGVKVIGDLTRRPEAEMLQVPNFGQTSLNEVKQKLAELGLALAGS
ncbi:MAG: tetratricopeptide repeat protein [Planctomycetes bacterium]|nr:tetratricopeptide repeat protein [Planctomycetota bacterium]